MPLTPSHAAAALPLSRVLRRLPLPALVLGTMSPDFLYLLHLAPRGKFGHTPLGLVVFCLPLGLLAYGIYEHLVRPALLGLLPPGVAADLRGPVARGARLAWGAAAAAVLLGAASHVAWDSFTHAGGWGVERIAVLRAPAVAGRPWSKVLQHASTVVGGLVVLLWAGLWLRRRPREARRYAPGAATRAGLRAAALLAVPALAAVANGLRALPLGRTMVLGYAAVGAMAGLAVALVAYGARLALRGSTP